MNITRIPILVVISALFVFIMTNLFSYFIFDHIPHVHDEICYVFQAKIFSLGMLYVPSPCSKESFDFPHMINNGKWYSQYPPGFPLLILPLLALGVPWMINPLLAFFSILVFYFLGKEIYNKHVGVISSILGGVSIWFLLMSSTMMSHTACMFFISLFLLFSFRSLKRPNVPNGLMAGFGLGMAFLCRPYTALLMSVPILIYYTLKSIPHWKMAYKNVCAFMAVVLVFIFVFLIYNYITNGHPLLSGYTLRYGQDHGLGFGKKGFTDTPLTPLLGATNILTYLISLNECLFGWPLSSLVALIPLIFAAKINRSEAKMDLLLLSSFITLLLGYFLYWATIILFGPRFIFEAMPIYLLLSARGISVLPGLLSQNIGALRYSYKTIWRVIIIGLMVFSLHGFFIRLPRWISPQDDFSYFTRLNSDFHGVTRKIHRAIVSAGLNNALIIVRCTYDPLDFFPDHWWGSGFIFNDPALKNDIIYAQNKGNIMELIRCFPSRDCYMYVGTLEKGMLIPLEIRNDKMEYQAPIVNIVKEKEAVVLVNDPLEFHEMYSAAFEQFMKSVYNKDDIADVDVPFLVKKAAENKHQGNFRDAAYYLEAALQIEKNPEARFMILSQLAPCYLKIGFPDDAKTIMDRLLSYALEKKGLHNVLPGKGF